MRRSAIANWSFFCFALALLAGSALSSAKDKDKDKRPEPYALLSGTCFDGRGFRLAGASVHAELTSESSVKLKKRKWETISSPRGEFAIRLPAGKHTFRVSAAKDGFKPVEKTVSFDADERQDIALSLETEPVKK
jgi:PEGA domain